MTIEKIDLKETFSEYFNQQEGFSLRSERFFEDVKSASPETLKKWLEAAYVKGARDMAQNSLDTLRGYGSQSSEFDVPRRTLSESYNLAAETLMGYYAKVLDDAENESA